MVTYVTAPQVSATTDGADGESADHRSRRATAAAVVDAVQSVPDPEIPVVTIADLGIIRDITTDDAASTVTVTITPTYSGCPAIEAMSAAVASAARDAGWCAVVQTRLAPAWTTDWISDRGRAALRSFGIAPPSPTHGAVPVPLSRRVVHCPVCGSPDTEELSRFGATACKALRRCRSCREPFEEFKAL